MKRYLLDLRVFNLLTFTHSAFFPLSLTSLTHSQGDSNQEQVEVCPQGWDREHQW